MNTVVQVKDKKFALYISEETIKARVKEVAAQIDQDLRKKNPLFLVILNGSFVFAADLLRDINFPCEITFLKMHLLYVCTIVVKLQVVRKVIYANSVFLVFNCVKWHLLV